MKVLALLLCLLIPGLAVSQKKEIQSQLEDRLAQSQADKIAQGIDPGLFKAIINSDHAYLICIPVNWEYEENTEGYVLVAMKPFASKDTSEALAVKVFPTNNLSLDQYAERLQKNFGAGTELVAMKSGQIQFRRISTVTAEAIKMTIYLTLANNQFYQFAFLTEQKHQNLFEKDFETIIKSLVILNK